MLIIIAGYHLTQLALGPWREFMLVMLATVGDCVVLHELVVRRVG